VTLPLDVKKPPATPGAIAYIGFDRAKGMNHMAWKRKLLGNDLGRLLDLLGQIVLVLPAQVLIDGAPGETVQDNPAQKVGIRLLDLFSLSSDIARQAHVELHGTGLPHRHTSPSTAGQKSTIFQFPLTREEIDDGLD
jgi:hypothetical protein